MAKKDAILISRDRSRPQLTGKWALRLAQDAFDAGRYPDAERLLSIAHDLFTAELPSDYVPSNVAKP